jgi:hypothetical protein
MWFHDKSKTRSRPPVCLRAESPEDRASPSTLLGLLGELGTASPPAEPQPASGR